jgi:hypothetical protein
VSSTGSAGVRAVRLLLHPLTFGIPMAVVPVLGGAGWWGAAFLVLASAYWAGLASGYANSGST